LPEIVEAGARGAVIGRVDAMNIDAAIKEAEESVFDTSRFWEVFSWDRHIEELTRIYGNARESLK
jgi:hypothetical protein